MLFYFIIFITLSLITLFSDHVTPTRKVNEIFLYFVIAFFIFFVGFRDDVGGDWGRYRNYYEFQLKPNDIFSFQKIFKSGHDAGYEFLQLIFLNLNLEFYFFTLFLGLIYICALANIAKKNDYKIFTFLIALPFLILIVGMGYIRQATALGFIIFALDQLNKSKSINFFILIFLAILFHKSALIFAPFILINSKKKIIILIPLLFLSFFIYYFLYIDLTRLFTLYLGSLQHLESGGAMIRYFFNLVPAIIFLSYSKILSNNNIEKKIYLTISVIILLFFPLVIYSSTSADRLLVYFSIIQLLVYPRINRLFNDSKFSIVYIKYTHIFIMISYFIFLYTWFSFSTFSDVWVPYQFFYLKWKLL